jgi:hypothetical protein
MTVLDLQSAGILREARGEFVILFGFRPKLVKIVKQNRTEFFSQIKKITNSENDSLLVEKYLRGTTTSRLLKIRFIGLRLSLISSEAGRFE